MARTLPALYIYMRKTAWFGFLLILFGSCMNTRYLPEGEQLYTSATIDITSEEEIPNRSELKSEMEKVIRPAPNATFLGIRPGLTIYNWVGEPKKEKGIRHWIRNKFGEPPVLFSDVKIITNLRLLENRLENFGHFTPVVSYDTIGRNRKVSINYKAELEKAYLIKSISFPTGSDELELRIRQNSEKSLLQPGNPYNLEQLMAERIRIDTHLKNTGFFFFNPDHIIFRVDSAVGHREVAIYISIKKDIPANAKKPYEINKVIINTNYSLDAAHMGVKGIDTTHVNGMFVFDENKDFQTGIFKRTVFLRPQERYARRNHELSLNHLMGLGTFQFVNIRFVEVAKNEGMGKLDAHINLTQVQRKTLRLELNAISKSNNFAGPGMSANFRNRNMFRGAELFIVNLRGNYETLIAGRQRGLNSYELGINTELHIPRFIAPKFMYRKKPTKFIPKTRIAAGYQLLNRVQFFWLNSFNASFGYLWSESIIKSHEFNPISLNYVRLGGVSEQFESILARNPILRRSFEQQLIFGSTYTFTYNDQLLDVRDHNYYFRGNVDIAGHSMHLAQNFLREEPSTVNQPHLILGIPYSQYSRLELDFRYYYRPSPKSRIVARMIAGAGVAYGNVQTLPYVKQFFIGGANSIRAFQPRSVGPGVYRTPVEEDGPPLFMDQTGDIKLESNLEYRFPIVAMLKGAVFLDAGNVWLARENPDLVIEGEPAGQFVYSQFYREMAVGSGFGLRVDVDFFVLRFDLGIPLRVPFVEPRWVIDEIDFGSPEWRRQSLVLNIAIGYPF